MKKKVTAIIVLSLVLLVLLPVDKIKAEEVKGSPKLILSSYKIDENFKDGEETNLHLTFKNESKKIYVSEVLVTLSSSNNTILPTEGRSNQIYIPIIDAEGSVEIDLPVIIDSYGKYDYALANFSLIYSVGDGASSANSSIYISIPLKRVSGLEVNNIFLSQGAQVGSSTIIGVNYSNTGEADIDSVILFVEGDGINNQYNLNAVDAGNNQYSEVYITFPEAKDYKMSTRLIYIDEYGSSFEIMAKELTVSVAPMPTQAPAQTEEPASGGMDMYKIFLYIAIIAVLGTVITLVVKKSK